MRTEKIGNLACLTQGIQVAIDKQFLKKNNEGLVRFLRIIDYTQNSDEYRYIDNPGKKYLVNDDDVVMIRYGDAGRVVRGYSGAIANNLFKISVNNNVILNKYLYYYLSQDKIYNRLTNSQQKTGLPAVNFKMVNELEVTYPKNIEIQKKVVIALDKAQELIDKRKAQIEELDELVKSKFIEMFGNPTTNSKGWIVEELSKCLINIENGKSFVCENFSRKGVYPAILKLSAVTYGIYNPSENKALTDEDLFIKSVEVKKGDLLFTRKNTPELVGMSAYVYETSPNLMMPDLIFRLNTNENCNKVYLWKLINHDFFRENIKALSNGSAKSMSNISKERLMKLNVPIPPIELQNQFAGFVKQVGKLKFEMQKSLTQLEDNFNSLMQKAFKGELFN